MTHYQQLKDYLNDELEFHFIEPTFHLIDKLLQEKVITDDDLHISNTVVTSSSGISITLIFKNKDTVYQIFASRQVYDRIKDFCEKMSPHYDNPDSKYIVKHKLCIDEHLAIAFEKIQPINNFKFDIYEMKRYVQEHMGKIKEDIDKALTFFNQTMGFYHGDARIDNIGYNETTGNFVLFDYDKSLCVKRSLADKRTFAKSLDSYGPEHYHWDERYSMWVDQNGFKMPD